jgi:hypothetical protein
VSALRGCASSFVGWRHWFRCPAIRNGILMEKRVGRLYLPLGQQIFACRICYNLTYWSAQTRDKRVNRMMRDPAALLSALGVRTLMKLFWLSKQIRDS